MVSRGVVHPWKNLSYSVVHFSEKARYNVVHLRGGPRIGLQRLNRSNGDIMQQFIQARKTSAPAAGHGRFEI